MLNSREESQFPSKKNYGKGVTYLKSTEIKYQNGYTPPVNLFKRGDVFLAASSADLRTTLARNFMKLGPFLGLRIIFFLYSDPVTNSMRSGASKSTISSNSELPNPSGRAKQIFRAAAKKT